MTGRDFCAAKAVSEASFYSWKREIGLRDQEEAERRETPSRTSRAGAAATALPAFVVPSRILVAEVAKIKL